jgi:hypothetical protein
MPTTEHEEHDNGLPPPGSRWGAGAQSVLPYLTKTLQAKPASAPEHPREPVAHEPRDLGQCGRERPAA